jgi:hypothetical protein
VFPYAPPLWLLLHFWAVHLSIIKSTSSTLMYFCFNTVLCDHNFYLCMFRQFCAHLWTCVSVAGSASQQHCNFVQTRDLYFNHIFAHLLVKFVLTASSLIAWTLLFLIWSVVRSRCFWDRDWWGSQNFEANHLDL